MTSQEKDHISHLIKKRSVARSTESLIGVIGDSNGMLPACSELLKTISSRDTSLEKWFYKECEVHGINQKLMLSEIENVVRLFSPNNTEQDAYSALNLSLGATQEQIKQAYRKLSLKYHPDTAKGHNREDPQKFIQINKAYHTLLNEETNGRNVASQNYQYSWQPEKKRSISSGQRKKVFAWTFGLIIILLIVSFVAAINYRKRTMIAGLQVSRGAFIPPSSASSVSSAPVPEIISSIGLPNDTYLQNTGNKEEGDTIAPNLKTVEEGGFQLRQREPPETVGEKDADIKDGEIEESAEQRESDSTAAKIPEFSNQKKKQTQGSPAIKSENIRLGEEIVLQRSEQEDRYSTKNQEQEKEKTEPQIADSKVDEIDDPNELHNNKSDVVVLEQDLQYKDLITEAKNSSTPSNEFTTLNSNVKNTFETSRVAEDGVSVVYNEQQEIDTTALTEKSVNNADLEGRINLFFDNYIKAYDERNIASFYKFFEADAIENGDPLSSKREIYSELFKSTAKVLLKISVLSWNNSDNKILVKGRFTIYLKYNDQRELNGSGPIIFVLNNTDELKVKELSYIFEDKNK